MKFDLKNSLIFISLFFLGGFFIWKKYNYKPKKKDMKLSKNGIKFLYNLESCSLDSYKDGKGYSIGYGHYLGNNPIPRITQAQADAFFSEDVKRFELLVNKNLKVPISQNGFDALVSHAYNTGKASETIYAMINRGERLDILRKWWSEHWLTAQGSDKPILKSRRIAEASLFNY